MTGSRTRKRAALGIAGLALSLGLTACGSDGSSNVNASESSEGGAFTIGLINNSAGAFANASADFVKGAKYAIDKLNEDGGVNGHSFDFAEGDLQGNAANAATLVPSLDGEGIVALVGPATSAETEVAFAISKGLEIPSFSVAGRPGVLDAARPFGWSLTEPEADVLHAVLTPYMEDQGYATAAIVADNVNAATAGNIPVFEDIFKNAGIDLVEEQEFSSGDPSFAAQVSAIKAAGPDVIAVVAGPDDAGRIAREIRSQGIDAALVGPAGIASNPATFLAAAGDAAEGFTTAGQFEAAPTEPPMSDLHAEARKDLGVEEVAETTSAAFDAVMIIASIIEDKELSPSDDLGELRRAINEGILALGEHTGMLGTVSFGENGHALRSHYVKRVEGGKLVTVEKVS